MIEVTSGSGNVFEDLNLPDPAGRLAKARLASHIAVITQNAGLTQVEAARRMGITQPALSNLLRGRLSGFSLDRLLHCLNAMDQDVEILVRPKRTDAKQASLLVGTAGLDFNP